MSKKNWLIAVVAFAVVAIAAIVFSVSCASNKTAGMLTGSAQGFHGEIVVAVDATKDRINSIKVTQHDETQGIGSVAVDQLPGKIVEAQSVNVDSISGCTVSSNGIKAAVRAALESGGLLAAFDKAVTAAAINRTPATLDTDVLIIGAGGAGLTASIEAANAGKSVLIIEKMPLVGGNSLKATGGLNAVNTHYQKEINSDSMDINTYVEETIAAGHDINNRDLVMTMARNSAAAIDFLDSIGAPLPKVGATAGTKHSYMHAPQDGSAVGPYLIARLQPAAEKAGAKIMLNTKATELIVKDGAVVGAKAEDNAHNYTINAKAVILATGGFGSNFEYMATFNPDLAHAVTTNHPGATGDGIMMATAIGADTVDLAQIQLHPTVHQQTSIMITEAVRTSGGILVNEEGKRFGNEMLARDVVSAAEFAQPNAHAYVIFDQKLVDSRKAAQSYIDSGITVKGNTYEELARAMGLSASAASEFVKTMNDYNAQVKAGATDPFGRSGAMVALEVGPYYAVNIAPGIHHTMGGLKIDTQTHVMNTSGKAIPGLFAAGEVTGGVHGGNRVGGHAVCDFTVFGRIAGQNAAAYAK